MPLGLFSSRSKKDVVTDGSANENVSSSNDKQQQSPRQSRKKQHDNGPPSPRQQRRSSKKTSSTSPSQSPKSTTKEATTVVVPSWKEAHRHSCFQQGTLVLSAQQVIQDGHFEIRNPTQAKARSDDPDACMWQERAKLLNDVTVRFQQQQHEEEGNVSSAKNDTKSTSAAAAAAADETEGPSVYSRISSVASTVGKIANYPFDLLTSPLADPRDDYDEDVDLSDAVTGYDMDTPPNNNPSQGTNSNSTNNNKVIYIHEQELLLNVDLTLRCLEYLKTRIELELPPPIMTTAQMNVWINHIAKQDVDRDASNNSNTVAQLVQRLPSSQTAFLLDVLVAADTVQRVDRSDSALSTDLILFPDPANRQDVRVSVYDLDLASQKTRARIQEFGQRAQQAKQEAIRLRNKGQKKEAIFQLKRHKRYEHEVALEYQKLTAMEEQKMALESANETHVLTEAMRQTAETLKNLRLSKAENKSLSTADTMDNLAEELQYAKEDELALTSPLEDLHPDLLLDEDQLLKELETYTKAEEDAIDVDELLEDISLLKLSEPGASSKPKKTGSTKKVPGSPTHAATVYGGSATDAAATTTTKKKKGDSPQRNRRGSNTKKSKEPEPKKEPKKLAAAVAL